MHKILLAVSLAFAATACQPRPAAPQPSRIASLPAPATTTCAPCNVQTNVAPTVSATGAPLDGDYDREAHALVKLDGGFSAVDAKQEFWVEYGGTHGGGGGRTGYLYNVRRVNGALERKVVRIFTSFSAENCIPIARPGRATLVLCNMRNEWSSVPDYRVALYNLTGPLNEDVVKYDGIESGFLQPLQTLVAMTPDTPAVRNSTYTCQSISPFPTLGLLPRIQALQLDEADPSAATFVVRAPITSAKQFGEVCKEMTRRHVGNPNFKLGPTEEPFDGFARDNEQALNDFAARFGGPAKRLFVRLKLNPTGDRMLMLADPSVQKQIIDLGYEIPR
jgi:hypothetical protein